jgi:hypothetical protein
MQGRKAAFQIAVLFAAALAVAPAVQAAEDAPPPAAGGVGFSDKTEMVDTPQGPALQIVFGERAVFHLDAKGEPVLDEAQKGQLAMAHPPGAVKETFAPPGPGKLAIAIDGSAEKQASYLKIWNGLDHPVIYHAGVLAFVKGKLTPMTVKVCAAPARGINDQTWPMPVQAIAVANFTAAPSDNTCS